MSKLRILVVDDDRDFADSLAEVLRLEKHTVDTAYTGEHAIELCKSQDYALTFMDVKLPGKSGVERFLEIRKMKPSAQIYMTTGFSVQQLLDDAISLGACGVLQKPLDLAWLLDTVSRIETVGPQTG